MPNRLSYALSDPSSASHNLLETYKSLMGRLILSNQANWSAVKSDRGTESTKSDIASFVKRNSHPPDEIDLITVILLI